MKTWLAEMGTSTVRAQPDPDGGTRRVISLQGIQGRIKPVAVMQDYPQANTEYYTNTFQLLLAILKKQVLKSHTFNFIEWRLLLLNTRYCYEDKPPSYSALAPSKGSQNPWVRNLLHATQQQSITYTSAQHQLSCLLVLCIALHPIATGCIQTCTKPRQL